MTRVSSIRLELRFKRQPRQKRGAKVVEVESKTYSSTVGVARLSLALPDSLSIRSTAVLSSFFLTPCCHGVKASDCIDYGLGCGSEFGESRRCHEGLMLS